MHGSPEQILNKGCELFLIQFLVGLEHVGLGTIDTAHLPRLDVPHVHTLVFIQGDGLPAHTHTHTHTHTLTHCAIDGDTSLTSSECSQFLS